jgi:hypothetical protein
MKITLGVLIGLALIARVHAAQTITATFENFKEGDSFEPSFTDPLSDITFSDSTYGSFGIDYSAMQFGGGNHLATMVIVGPVSSWDNFFGFTGTLPAPANRVSIDVSYPGFENVSGLLLKAFDGRNNVVAQQFGPPNYPAEPFTMQVTSSQFDIAKFQIVPNGGIDSVYDNISYTIAPDPMNLASIATATLVYAARRARKH